jgi:hypothetical protein
LRGFRHFPNKFSDFETCQRGRKDNNAPRRTASSRAVSGFSFLSQARGGGNIPIADTLSRMSIKTGKAF